MIKYIFILTIGCFVVGCGGDECKIVYNNQTDDGCIVKTQCGDDEYMVYVEMGIYAGSVVTCKKPMSRDGAVLTPVAGSVCETAKTADDFLSYCIHSLFADN